MYVYRNFNQEEHSHQDQDTSDDLLRLRMIPHRLSVLKEELGSVQVPETNRQCKEFIINELNTLEEKISSALTPVRTSYCLALRLTTIWLLGGQLLHDERGQPHQPWHSSKVAEDLA